MKGFSQSHQYSALPIEFKSLPLVSKSGQTNEKNKKKIAKKKNGLYYIVTLIQLGTW